MSNDGCLQGETAKAKLNTKPMVTRTQQERWKAAPLVALLRSRLGWMLCSSFDILKLLFTFPLFPNFLWFQKSLGKLPAKTWGGHLAQMSSPWTRVYSEEMPGRFGRPPAPCDAAPGNTDDYMVNPHVGASSWIPWTPCFGPSGMARQHSEFRGWMC